MLPLSYHYPQLIPAQTFPSPAPAPSLLPAQENKPAQGLAQVTKAIETTCMTKNSVEAPARDFPRPPGSIHQIPLWRSAGAVGTPGDSAALLSIA